MTEIFFGGNSGSGWDGVVGEILGVVAPLSMAGTMSGVSRVHTTPGHLHGV